MILAWAALAGQFLSADPLWSQSSLPVFRQATALCGKGSYDAATGLAASLAGRERALLLAVVCLARFEDLHDPSQLQTASRHLETVLDGLKEDSPGQRFLMALALTQKAVVAEKLGNSVTAAWSGRKAARLCEALKEEGFSQSDLDGILGGYLFWKAQALGAARSLLGGDTRERGIRLTQGASQSSSPFQEAYRTSLTWIRFEQKRYADGLQLCLQALEQSPNNRIWQQAKGDMLFRMGRLNEALDTYRSSWNAYAGIEVLPVGRQSAAGNLARIHLALGNADSARKWMRTFDDPRQAASRKWLPGSLLREVAPLRKQLGLPTP